MKLASGSRSLTTPSSKDGGFTAAAMIVASTNVEGERPAFGVASCIRPDAGGATHVLEPLLSARGQAICPGNVARMGLL
jgi:hypothetical protein